MFKLHSFPLLLLLYIILSSFVVVLVHADNVECSKLAAEGQCDTNKAYMDQYCLQTCIHWKQNLLKYRSYHLPEDSLEDIVLRTSSGRKVNFENFEGYITMLLPIAKTCSSSSKVQPHIMFEQIERLHSVWPWAIEILVFPFEFPGADYSNQNCDFFDFEYKKKGRKIYVMEESNLFPNNNKKGGEKGEDEGEKMDNPLFELLFETMGDDTVNLNTTMYFVISPDLMSFEYHYGKSLIQMQDIMSLWVQSMRNEREL